MEELFSDPVPENEFKRILEISDLDLDYSNLQDHFKDLTKLAAKVTGADISLVNIIDSYTQWSVSTHGLDIAQMPRDESVCQYTIMGDKPFEVENLSLDNRFKDRWYVTGDPNLRYYFGVPLQSRGGNNLGALCVLDNKEKKLTPEKVELLKIIADEIVNRLFSLRLIKQLKDEMKEMGENQRKMSHDIRGPISGIIGLAGIIKDQLTENKLDDISELMDLIHKGGRSVLDLADEILSAQNNQSQGQVEGVKPKSDEYNLITLSQKLLELYEPQARSKGVKLEVQHSDGNSNIPSPKNKILQIIGNVISNAIKFTPEEGTVSIKIDLEIVNKTKNVTFTVRDNGVGISGENIKAILEGEKDTTKGTGGEKGYGFGLALVQHLVKTLHGDIDIKSTIGEGSTFIIKLPLK